MPAIEIPDPLPPAITLPCEGIEFAISQHLAELGEHSLVARTWHWILHRVGQLPGLSLGHARVPRRGLASAILINRARTRVRWFDGQAERDQDVGTEGQEHR